MKKTYFLLLALCFFTTANAQIVNIPDANFKAKLLEASSSNKTAKDLSGNYFKIDANNDGQIQESEASQVSYLNLNNSASFSVEGLSFFNNLITLECTDNKYLTSLDVRGLINLTDLTCSWNGLKSVNVAGLTNLKNLDCRYNGIKNLDVTSLINLEKLICDHNSMTSLNVAGLKKILQINCDTNALISLDLTGVIALKYLSCDSCQYLTTLDLSEQSHLIYVNLGYCTVLESLFIKNGNVETVDLTACYELRYICADESQLARMINYVSYSVLVTSYCSFTPGGIFYKLIGQQKWDNNKNGCDALDAVFPNLKLQIANGSLSGTFVSDAKGGYVIPVTKGTHTITPKLENPSYFAVSPTTVNVTFPTQTSPFTQNFCITPNGVRPDLEVTLLPLESARPGFDAKYKLVYKNKGNTIQSGAVNLTYNDAVLDLVVANPVTSAQSTNTLSWYFTNLKPFETREITFMMNVNSPMEIPAVNNGDILNFTTTITSSATDETPTDNAFTFNQTVVGSYDPNDKTCLEGSVITPALIGQYVHYLIRFENTGTFAAQNIVVKDMIDLAKFDISTLVPTSASHSFVTKISDGNKVEFIFENINLPFDDANNDGYIAFKIKTLPTLMVNDTFTNEANIYFDYNFPIVTNKATSTFKTLETQDFEFSNYFTVYPNPAKAELNIASRETINVKSISIYNTLGQLVLVVTNPEKTANIDVSSLTAGNYFIQIKTVKGNSSARFVKE
jgi:Secretion system C-terminal sorting domain